MKNVLVISKGQALSKAFQKFMPDVMKYIEE